MMQRGRQDQDPDEVVYYRVQALIVVQDWLSWEMSRTLKMLRVTSDVRLFV